MMNIDEQSIQQLMSRFIEAYSATIYAEVTSSTIFHLPSWWSTARRPHDTGQASFWNWNWSQVI